MCIYTRQQFLSFKKKTTTLQEKAQLERMMGQLVHVLEKEDQYATFRYRAHRIPAP
jgi:hypothetical protein